MHTNWRIWWFCERIDLARVTAKIAMRDDIFLSFCQRRGIFPRLPARSIVFHAVNKDWWSDNCTSEDSPDWLIDLLKAFNYCRPMIVAIISNHASKYFNFSRRWSGRGVSHQQALVWRFADISIAHRVADLVTSKISFCGDSSLHFDSNNRDAPAEINIKLYELSARDDIELISANRRLMFCLFLSNYRPRLIDFSLSIDY